MEFHFSLKYSFAYGFHMFFCNPLLIMDFQDEGKNFLIAFGFVLSMYVGQFAIQHQGINPWEMHRWIIAF